MMFDVQVWAHDDPARHIQKEKDRQKVIFPDDNKFNLIRQDV